MRGVWTIGVVALGGALLAACGDDGGSFLPAVGVDVDIDQQTVPGLLPVPSCDLGTLPLVDNILSPIRIDVAAEEELDGEDFIGLADVRVDEIRLRIVNEAGGDTDNFDFVDSIRLYADDPTDDRERVLVAELDPVPNGVKEIVIPGKDVDVSDIASNDNFTVSGEGTGFLPCDAVHFEGEVEFDVSLF